MTGCPQISTLSRVVLSAKKEDEANGVERTLFRQQSMANVPTLECSQVEAGNVEGCSYEEGKDFDQTK
ncbi:hypothetical protein EMCRGX_G016335 [Ephydatia muelleri]